MLVGAMVEWEMGEMVTREKKRRGKVFKSFSQWVAVHVPAHALTGPAVG